MSDRTTPEWFARTVWWHVYPLGFLGAHPPERAGPAPAAGRLRALAPWLDYLRDLGCDGLQLGPIFAAETHGYDTVDHLAVDPRLGTLDDLRWLVDACHARGVRLMLDGVFNHVGRTFGPFADVLRAGRASRYAEWFKLDWSAGGPDGFAYDRFEGHAQLVALNHAAPAVADYVAGVMDRWLAFGVDGWRLDAAYAVPPDFWRAVLARVRPNHPAAVFVGEVIHGDYAGYIRASTLDSLTQYELWKATWSGLNDLNFFELAWAFKRHNGFAEVFSPLTFVGNHDVTRLASQLTDMRHLPHALAILFTVAGSPSVYAGDEQAFRGTKEARSGGDDDIRPAFPPTPAGLAPWGWSVHALHRDLIALRRAHPALCRAPVSIDHLAARQLVYRAGSADQPLVVALNLDDAPAGLPLPAGSHRPRLGDATVRDGRLTLPPHGWAILGAG